MQNPPITGATAMNHQPKTTAGKDSTRSVEKHLELHRAIISIEDAEIHLSILLTRVVGPSPSDVSADKPLQGEEPTLKDVLQYGPERINISLSRLHDLINELENSLF